MIHPEVPGFLRSATSEDEVHTFQYYPDKNLRSSRNKRFRLVMKSLLETADSLASLDSSNVSAWLKELLHSDIKDYDSSLAPFRDDPNATTLAISDELVRISDIIVVK